MLNSFYFFRFITELRMAEMAEMGIGNKPCLDIRPSQDQISDRSISYAQLSKGKKAKNTFWKIRFYWQLHFFILN
jgi:hypothetical protein